MCIYISTNLYTYTISHICYAYLQTSNCNQLLPCISGLKPMKSKSSDRGGEVNHCLHSAAPIRSLQSGEEFDSGTAKSRGEKLT